MDTQKLIQTLRDKNIILFLTITGGGTGAINQLLEYGGASDVFFGAHVPYSYRVSEEEPKKYCSKEYAKELAMDGLDKLVVGAALDQDLIKNKNFVSVGVTASLAKREGNRAGRINEAFIHQIYDAANKAIDNLDSLEHTTGHLTLNSKECRKAQEDRLSEVILEFIQDMCDEL